MAQDLIDKISAQAQARGLDPDIAVRIAQAESSMDPLAKARGSTAGGLFQITNGTWKEYGGKPGMKFDVDENIRVGLNILEANTKKLRRSLDREPSITELYAAHFLGSSGGPKVMLADPSVPVDKILSEQAMQANPTLKGKTVGEVVAVLDRKMGVKPQVAAKPAGTPAAPMPAAAAGAPKRVAAVSAPVAAAAPAAPAAADMGAGYQAALALSFLGDEEDKAEKGEDDSAAKMLAAYKPYNALKDFDLGPSIVAQMPLTPGQAPAQAQPKMMADGGEVTGIGRVVDFIAQRVPPEAFPTAGRTLLESVQGKKEPITEASFSKDELDVLRRLTAGGKGTINYQDYSDLAGQMRQEGRKNVDATASFFSLGSPLGNVRNTLGRFTYARDPSGNVVIVDKYDFNPPDQSQTQEARTADYGVFGPYNLVREYAGQKLPPGKGRDVRVNLGPPVKRAGGSPETGEVAEPTPEELEAASRAAFITSKSGIGRKQSLTSGQVNDAVLAGVQQTPYNLLGAPVDLTALAMRPFGYSNPSPVMGSEWLKEQATRLGVRPATPTQPTARALYEMGQFGAGLANPAGVARTVGPVVEAGVKAGTKAVGRQLDRAVMENTGPLAKAVSDVARPMYITRPAGGEFPTAPFGQDPRSNLDKFLKGMIEDVQDQPGNPMSPEKAAAATEFFDKKLRSFFRSQAGSVSDPVREAIIAGKIKFKKDSPEEEMFPQALIDAARKGDVTAMRAIENAYDKSIQVKPYRVEQANETYDQTRNAETAYRQSLLAQMAANPSVIPDSMLLRLTTKNADTLAPADAAARVADIRAKMAANPTYFSVVLEPKIDRLLSSSTLESVTPGSLSSYPDLYPALTSMQNAPPGKGIAGLGMGERPVMDVNTSYLKPLGLKDQNILDTIDALSTKDLKQMSVPEFFSKAMEVKGRTGEIDSYVKKAGDLVRADQPVPAKVAFFGTEEFIAPDRAGMSWREITDPLATRIHGEMLNNSIAGYSRPGTYGALSKGRLALDEGAVRLFGLYDKNNRLVTNVEYVTPEAGGSQANSITQFYGNGPRTGNVTPENYLPQVESLVRQLDPDKIPYRIQDLFQKNGITFTKK